MSDNHTFTFKAVINKHKTRVLFAEFDENFADVLLAFAKLPLRLIVRALVLHYGDKAPAIGSLNNLHNGIAKYCNNTSSWSEGILTSESVYRFPFCHTRYLSYVPETKLLENGYFWVFDIFSEYSGTTSFFICDDLRIVANGEGSLLEIFNSIGVAIAYMDGAEIRDVTLSVDQVMDFLVRMLISRRPLSDIVLGSTENSEHGETKSEEEFVLGKAATPNDKKVILKATLQKSTKKLLFVQTDEQFVSYLYGLLKTPLGRVDKQLGGNSCFNNIGTLHRSLAAFVPKSIKDMYGYAFSSDKFDSYWNGMYMLTHDFNIKHVSLFASLSVLDELKISVSDVEEVEFQLGSEEALSFLKTCLTSAHALTDLFINLGLKIQQKPKQEN